MSILDRVEHIKNYWFFVEPAYYLIIGLLEIKIDSSVHPIAVGNKKLYIHPEEFNNTPDKVLEEYIKFECVRIMLKHPFERKLPNTLFMYQASNACIMDYESFRLPYNTTYCLFGDSYSHKNSYEEIYTRLVKEMHEHQQSQSEGDCNQDPDDEETDNDKSNSESDGKSNTGDTPSNNGNGSGNSEGDNKPNGNAGKPKPGGGLSQTEIAQANSQYWGEDDDMISVVSNAIEKLVSSSSFGTLPNDLIEAILSGPPVKYDYDSIIKMFRTSVISSSRRMTRMKPNRRFGYVQMGSKMQYDANLLIVLDMSASESDAQISRTLGFVGGFFKNGVSSIDLIQFDVCVYDDSLETFTTKPKSLTTVSRGGTMVDDIVHYINKRSKKRYDGVIICTDGIFDYDASLWSTIRTKVLWAVDTEEKFQEMKTMIGRNERVTYLKIYDKI